MYTVSIGAPLSLRFVRAGVCGLPLVLPLVLSGCANATRAQPAIAPQAALAFYADGAGGGSVLTDWGRGVSDGLRAAGYGGTFIEYHWQTGLGVVADQATSVACKRDKAAALAARIHDYLQQHPGQPVHLIGLSAGTAIVVFALEALPRHDQVDQVILLGSSLEHHYDLTAALKHVRGRVYVFTSPHDPVLKFLAPLAGTADRVYFAARAAGLDGFHMPSTHDPLARQLYNKVENISWRPEFATAGYSGGHTDTTRPPFVRDYLAPLILGTGPQFPESGRAPTGTELSASN